MLRGVGKVELWGLRGDGVVRMGCRSGEAGMGLAMVMGGVMG